MTPRRRRLYRLALGLVLLGALNAPFFLAADEPAAAARELRTQKVGAVTYFHVRLEAPKDMLDLARLQQSVRDGETADLSRLPRLIPQDGKARVVYLRLPAFDGPQFRPGQPRASEDQPVPPPAKDKGPGDVKDKDAPRRPAAVEGLEFVGRIEGAGTAKFVLLYPLPKDSDAPAPRGKIRDRLKKALKGKPGWAEVEIELDFAKAKKIAVPEEAARRKPSQPPVRDDLEGLWASAQVTAFNLAETESPDFGFFSFARTATERKYGVNAQPVFTFSSRQPSRPGPRGILPGGVASTEELYEMTTGAAAITESLALTRMITPNFRDDGKRTVEVAKIAGIDIAEHPWKKMMGENKPAADPLAKLIPHDNYYIRFKSIRKFLELGALMELWGSNLSRAFQLTSRDHGIHARYEKQLCLKSSWLGKTFGPAVIKSVAVTGNDPYLREGSDVTIIFDVINKDLFLTAVEPFLKDARKEYGDSAQGREGRAPGRHD